MQFRKSFLLTPSDVSIVNWNNKILILNWNTIYLYPTLWYLQLYKYLYKIHQNIIFSYNVIFSFDSFIREPKYYNIHYITKYFIQLY